VRIDGWRVDGFGILNDFRQEGLEPGVTVFLGENEAGKSTLLAFVRAVLFGFPRANARDERSYPPLRGGRHGGKLLLRDGNGGLWTISRYAEGSREAAVTRPDGTAGTAEQLAVLLGGAGRLVFKSVFAFGLDELQKLESLTGEDVGNRIFDRSITGAGKSAREVIAALAKRQDELLKQRRGEAEVNNTVRKILGVEGELASARRLVGAYESLQATVDEQSAHAKSLHDDADEKQLRKTLIETFIELRPEWDELQERRMELNDLPAVQDAALAGDLAGLVEELVSLRVLEQGLDQLEATRATEAAAIDEAIASLGDGWDVARARSSDTSVVVQDQARVWRSKLEDAGQVLRAATERREEANRNVAVQRGHAGGVSAEIPESEPLTIEQIDEREARLARLRDDASRLEKLRLLDEHARRTGPPRTWLAFVLAGVAALGAGGAWLTGYPQLGLGLIAAAALLCLAGLFLRGRLPSAEGTEAEEPGVLAQLEDSIADAARTLGLSQSPSSVEISSLEAHLRSERSHRADWNAIQGRVNDAQSQVDEAERVAAEAVDQEAEVREATDKVTAGWSTWLAAHDLADLSPDGVLDVLSEIKATSDAKGRLDIAAGAIKAIADQAETWDKRARDALDRAARPSTELSGEVLRSALGELHADFQRRGFVQGEIERLERAVSVRLARSEDLEAATDELASGDAGIWADEAVTLATEIKGLHGERDNVLAVATEATVEIRRIEESADIPRLQEEREALRAELAELVREYQVVSAARQLISDTLKSYVRDRQPAVLASGSDAFATVTGGRYVRVEQDEEGELETVVVIDRDGARLTPDVLSRGTQQQLYLSIRLALVEMFAKSNAPLPMVMDDCLVNFDPKRAAALAALLAERAADGQALLFTCHPETAELMERQTAGPVRVIEMPVR